MSIHQYVDAGAAPPPAGGALRWGTRYIESDLSVVTAFSPNLLVRRAFPWSNVQPTQTGGYNWSGTDGWINGMLSRGIKPMCVVQSAPSWVGTGQNYPAGFTSYLYNMVAAAAVRYGDNVLFEIYNEPNLSTWTAAQVGEVLGGCANAAVSANHNAKVGGITRAGCLSAAASWTNTILAVIKGAPVYFISWHDYSRPNAPEFAQNGNVYNQVQDTIALCRAGGFTGKFCITEFGDPTTYSGTRAPGYVSEDDAKRWLVRQSLLHVCFPDILYSVQFQLWGYSTADEYGGMGLIRAANDHGGPGGASAGPAGSFKPGYYSMQTMQSIFDAHFVSATAESLGPLYRVKYTKDNGLFGYVVWTTSGTQSAALTGLTPNVRVTQLLGSSAIVATTAGGLTVTATVDPQYIETV